MRIENDQIRQVAKLFFSVSMRDLFCDFFLCGTRIEAKCVFLGLPIDASVNQFSNQMLQVVKLRNQNHFHLQVSFARAFDTLLICLCPWTFSMIFMHLVYRLLARCPMLLTAKKVNSEAENSENSLIKLKIRTSEIENEIEIILGFCLMALLSPAHYRSGLLRTRHWWGIEEIFLAVSQEF